MRRIVGWNVVVDLSDTSVFLDFDGTVTTVDTGVHLLSRLADDASWRPIDDAYVRGELGSRECLTQEWSLLPRDESVLRSVAAETPIDPGFEPLVSALRDAGAEVLVVSDGFGFLARDVCARVGVGCVTNEVDWSTFSLGFPNADRCCPCSTCGTCKQAPIKDARARGRRTVFVGDGASDRKAAVLADELFAKDGLAYWCDDAGVAYEWFDCLDDVRLALVGS
jgi:HAD superfamily phosphoserine phosphatase-like hydrolase